MPARMFRPDRCSSLLGRLVKPAMERVQCRLAGTSERDQSLDGEEEIATFHSRRFQLRRTIRPLYGETQISTLRVLHGDVSSARLSVALQTNHRELHPLERMNPHRHRDPLAE
jgi:hypothetical protein